MCSYGHVVVPVLDFHPLLSRIYTSVLDYMDTMQRPQIGPFEQGRLDPVPGGGRAAIVMK